MSDEILFIVILQDTTKKYLVISRKQLRWKKLKMNLENILSNMLFKKLLLESFVRGVGKTTGVVVVMGLATGVFYFTKHLLEIRDSTKKQSKKPTVTLATEQRDFKSVFDVIR
jgi:hypothetical protein